MSGCGWWTQSFWAVINAIRNQNDESVRVLVGHCGLVAPTWWTDDGNEYWKHESRFATFISNVNIHDDGDMRAMEFLLKIGANVDEAVPRLEIKSAKESRWVA